MKKILLFAIGICLIAQLGFADLYAVFDKTTGDCLGTAEVAEESLLDWTQGYIMREVDEGFRGKQHYEIEYQGNEVRMATQQEIEDYETAVADEDKASRKQKYLDAMGLTEEDLEEVKKLKDKTP